MVRGRIIRGYDVAADIPGRDSIYAEEESACCGKMYAKALFFFVEE